MTGRGGRFFHYTALNVLFFYSMHDLINTNKIKAENNLETPVEAEMRNVHASSQHPDLIVTVPGRWSIQLQRLHHVVRLHQCCEQQQSHYAAHFPKAAFLRPIGTWGVGGGVAETLADIRK